MASKMDLFDVMLIQARGWLVTRDVGNVFPAQRPGPWSNLGIDAELVLRSSLLLDFVLGGMLG